MSADKDYLGDSVYIDHEGCLIVLTTENGLGGPSNKIYLDLYQVPRIGQYVDRIRQKYTEQAKTVAQDAPG